jgi:hypothetical protein
MELETETTKNKTEPPIPKIEKHFLEMPERYFGNFTDSADRVDYAIATFKAHYENLSEIENPDRRFRMALMNMKRDNRNKKDLDGNNIELSDRGLHEVSIFLGSLKNHIINDYEIGEREYEYAITKVKMSQEIGNLYDPEKTFEENMNVFREQYAEVIDKYDKDYWREIADFEKFYQEHLEIEKQQEMFETHSKKSENERITLVISDTIGTLEISMGDYEDFSLYDVFQAAEINNKPHLAAHAITHVINNADSFMLNGEEVTKEQRKEIINHLTRDGPEEMVKKLDSIHKSRV